MDWRKCKTNHSLGPSNGLITKNIGNEQRVGFRHLINEIPSTTYATFGLYRYPAKFIPQVVAYALKEYGSPGASVIDPFAGYGTVGTVSRLYGMNYELWDLNPLLDHLHPISVLQPPIVNHANLIRDMSFHPHAFTPDWPNLEYWYPETFIPMLKRAWGYYHNLEEGPEKQLLLIPLLRTTRSFSYNDERRQKLSKSPTSTRRAESLLAQDWRHMFFKQVGDRVETTTRRLKEYASLDPKPVKAVIKAGYDGLSLHPENQHDLLLTSPPYLHAQEYIRASKMDLFWLGYSNNDIRELTRHEIPYRAAPECEILSQTYHEYLYRVNEPHMRRIFQRYFCGVLGVLTKLQEHIRQYLLLFVGPSSLRGQGIPMAKIYSEHMSSLGWDHTETLVDSIVSREMFFYPVNPATGLVDERMTTEHLLVLKRN